MYSKLFEPPSNTNTLNACATAPARGCIALALIKHRVGGGVPRGFLAEAVVCVLCGHVDKVCARQYIRHSHARGLSEKYVRAQIKV